MPQIVCPPLIKNDDNGNSPEKSVEELDNDNKAWVEGCIARTTLDVVKHIGTHEAVNDVEAIRKALGETQLNAIAYSYGTQVAQLYAERFPQNVRAMVLDGVVDLTDSAFDVNYKQALSFQRSFSRFSTYCEENRACPLSKKGGVKQYHALLDSVNQQVLADDNGNEINSDNVLKATTNALYSSGNWPALARLLSSIDSGRFDYDTLQKLETFSTTDAEPMQIRAPIKKRGYLPENSGENSEENSLDTESNNMTVIDCVDMADPSISVAQSRRNEQKIAEAAAYSNYSASNSFPRGLCDFFPFKGKLVPHAPVISAALPRLLFVAQLNDPATPYANAKNMVKYFRGHLITVDGDGHTLALSDENQCVDKSVVEYFMAPETVVSDTQC